MNTNPKCPRCGGEITRGEPKCKHCGVFLKWKTPLQKGEANGERKEETAPAGAMTVRLPAPPTPETTQNAGAKFCAQCGTRLEAGQRFCPECGARADGVAGPGAARTPRGEGEPPEGMRKLTVDERPPSFLEAWSRGWRFSCKGRATRKEYWLRALCGLIELQIVGIVAQIALLVGGEVAGFAIFGLYGLAVLIPGLCLFTRRCHDTGRSGVWTIVLWLATLPWLVSNGMVVGKSEYELWQMKRAGFLPSQGVMIALGVLAFAAGLIALIVTLLPSQDRANKWGPDPHKPFASKIRPLK